MNTGFIILAHIKVSGPEALDFLQGQLSCDMREVTDQPIPGAYCDNKGRVIASAAVFKNQSDYIIELPEAIAKQTLQILQKYARFAQVSLDYTISSKKLDLRENIRKKIAVILPETSGLFTPHELNYPLLNFISFKKGCYKGQEIIARMHYLGKLKKQLLYIQINALTEIRPDDQLVNIIANNSNYEALMLTKSE